MRILQKTLFFFFISCFSFQSIGQITNNNGGLLTDMIDTTTRIGKSMLSLNSRLGKIGFSGYLQPQFQVAESNGAGGNIYNGGDFGPHVNNRFRLRRGRFRADFSHLTDDGRPSTYFVFQFDGTERGVNIRDFWGRVFEHKWDLFHFSAGVMARPFGHEVLLSSAFREAPERGRMSQTLVQTERDLGFMFSFNPRRKNSNFKWLAIDLGIYNGQGLTGTAEYDSHKDVVARISSKRRTISRSGGKLSWGVSSYLGGLTSQNALMYAAKTVDGKPIIEKDSAISNIGRTAPRRYLGADFQLVFPNKNGQTEFRAEYIRGVQTATATSSTTPGSYPVSSAGVPLPLYTRRFDGAYFYFLQHLGSQSHQLVLKYDWYNPNTDVKGKMIDVKNGFTGADVRFDTFGSGYVYYVNQYLRVVFWYEHPINEKTAVKGYESDVKDGVFTLRTHFNF
ncbi:porin [Runella aurantiaca]|nr:porin [Runella aurantiaca]